MPATWADLFERAPDGVTVADVREALAAHRRGEPAAGGGDGERE
ncbi:MAG: hypothetical protein ABEJ70_06775 [Halobacteriaceae archaeon]